MASILERLGFGRRIRALLSQESRFLGVDVGSSSIKLAELRKEKERAVLETYGELSLARYGAADGDVGRSFKVLDAKLSEALKDLIQESQAKSKKAIVSIPLKNSFLTTMELPELSSDELKEAIMFEARKYIPIPVAEVAIDWWVLPPTSKDQGSSSIGSGKRKFVNVLLAAVPKEVVEKYKDIFRNAGLEISAFEIEAFSFSRASLKQEFGTVMMVDMGASATKMIIADAGVVRASHSFDRGSQEFTLALSQSLSIDFARAEILKRESGIIRKPETEGVAQVLEPLVDYMASEAERFLINWQRHGGRAISKIIIGGGGALLAGSADFFVKKFGVEVAVVNPFSKVVYPAFLEPALKNVGAAFANAIGLALREF